MPRISSVVILSLSTVPTIRPWYMTEIRSDRSNTSWISWLTRKMPMPSDFNWRIRSRTCAVSAGPRAAVGSSMMRIRALKWTARAMATDCRWPPDSDFTGFLKPVKLGLRRPMTLRVADSMATSSSIPVRVTSSRPRNRFALAVRLSASANVW